VVMPRFCANCHETHRPRDDGVELDASLTSANTRRMLACSRLIPLYRLTVTPVRTGTWTVVEKSRRVRRVV
jgi:hypothetical protein